jgi:hypothetical protein
MNRRQTIGCQSFVIESGGRAVLAFRASNMKEAKKLCSRDWFAQELASFRSRGEPIWDGQAKLTIRQATDLEHAEVEIAKAGEVARHEYEGYAFAFLVPLDAEVQ